MVETGERICEVPCNAPTFTVAWHPQKPLLAFACDDKVNTEAIHVRERSCDICYWGCFLWFCVYHSYCNNPSQRMQLIGFFSGQDNT